jgi:hypothetical protein
MSPRTARGTRPIDSSLSAVDAQGRRDYDPDYRGISIGHRLVMAAE